MTKRNLALVATIIGSGVAFLDGTVVTLALPSIQHQFNASFADLQWIVDGYTLTLASLILLGGSLGDILGRKRTYLFGLLGFGVMSLLCGLAPNVDMLILFRLLQGVFGALLIPGGLAIINTNFPQEERGRAIGTWAAWSGIFAAIGPILGGWLIDVGSWRWVFFINIPLIAICWLLGTANINESRDVRSRRLDYVGAALAAASLAGITYGLIEGPFNHWSMASILGLVMGVVLAPIWLYHQKKNKDPMVDLKLFRSRNFTGANAMTFAMYGALAGFMFALVVYLQTKVGYSAIKSGAILLPITALLLLFSSRLGGLAARIGARYFMTVGPLVAALGIISLYNYGPGDSYLTFLLPRVLLFGAGLTLLVAPLTGKVMSSVPEEQSGIASGVNNAVSRLGGLIVIALLGLLGTDSVFQFSIALCAALAASAGLISFLTIRDQKFHSQPKPDSIKS